MNLTIDRIREVQIKYKTLEKFDMPIKITNSEDLFTVFKNMMTTERVEVFHVLMLNSKNRIMGLETISRGSLSTAIVHPREAFTTPVRFQAASVVFMHNHPSNDATPSRQDHDCTDRLYQAGEILGIKVLDHVIFGESDYYSFADNGKLGTGVFEDPEPVQNSELVIEGK